MAVQFLDPVQEPVAALQHPAPRLDTLNGKRLGLYNNDKLNSVRLLDMIAEELAQNHIFEVQTGSYWAFKLMEPAEWGDVDQCDAVILANGDCGACSSSGIANAMELEKRGIPCLLISTPPFYDAITTMAKLGGMLDLRWAVIDHPLGSLAEDELRERAQDASRQFCEVIFSGPADAALATAAE
ncbi:MAG: hypothetical protein P8J20_19430 [Novosphingobium sp.]|nr:hypothetical protein [Novosphingobium sp.]